jgi:hypothetical protein
VYTGLAEAGTLQDAGASAHDNRVAGECPRFAVQGQRTCTAVCDSGRSQLKFACALISASTAWPARRAPIPSLRNAGIKTQPTCYRKAVIPLRRCRSCCRSST